MSAPRRTCALRRRLSPEGREEEVLGDLEEIQRARVRHRGRFVGELLTALETLDMARAPRRRFRIGNNS